MKRNTLTLALTTSLALSLAGAARAHEWDSCWTGADLRWPGTTLTLRAHSGGFPAGGYWEKGLQSSRGAWDKSPSRFRYTISTGDSSVAMANGQSEIWWSGSLDEDVLGVCYTWYNTFTCKYTEADIALNADSSFTTSESKTNGWAYGGGLYDKKTKPFQFQATVIHELGHAQGLMHEGDTYNVMGLADTHMHANGSTARCYPGEDAVDGSIEVYGKLQQPLEDLAVSHWRYLGKFEVDGQLPYSTHARCRILKDGAELTGGLISDREPYYDVDKNLSVSLELSYENLGKSTKTVTVKYYLSSNDYISKYDSYLGSRTMTLGVNTVYTSNTTLTIPDWVTSGKTYWLGAVIDADDAIDEIDDWNNATYIAVKVK